MTYKHASPIEFINPMQHSLQPVSVFCFGTTRGGTSMVAGVLRLLQIDMGNANDANNEDQDIIDARGPIRTLKRRDAPAYANTLGRIQRVLRGRSAARRPWGWKDPHGVYYANVALEYLPNPRIIIVFRDPLAAAQRATLQGNGPIMRALDDAIHMYEAAVDFVKLHQDVPIALVSYERATRHPRQFIQQLADFVSAPVSMQDIDRISSFIRPECAAIKVSTI